MSYVRFILSESDPDSGVSEGILQGAYRLRSAKDIGVHDRRILDELLEWFDRNLARPRRFNTSTSKGYYRRTPRGISWLRDSASHHIAKMRAIANVLQEHSCRVRMITSRRIGYIVYEDEHQVVAEPFADTPTS